MDDAGAARQGLLQPACVAHVPANQFRRFRKGGSDPSVDLLDERIVETNLMTMGKEFRGDVPSDEAASAGHEQSRHSHPDPEDYPTWLEPTDMADGSDPAPPLPPDAGAPSSSSGTARRRGVFRGGCRDRRRVTVEEAAVNRHVARVAQDTAAVGARLRAAQVLGPGKVELVDLPLPVPAEDEVRVRLEGCGVCASNLAPWAGPDWMEFPTSPGGLGHEGWGRVEAVGARVHDLRPGDRVALLGQASYASHDLVKAADAVLLPPALDGLPFPGEAFACAMNILRRSAIVPGDRVAVVGVGFIGAALTRLAAGQGAEVLALSRSEGARVLARRMGAARTFDAADPGVIREVRDLTGGRLCDVVIEAVGSQDALDLAGELVAEGGRLVIAGYHQDGPRQVDMQQWNWRGIDVVNAHERSPETYRRGLREAVQAVVAGRLDPQALVTHVFPLDRLGDALDAARDKPEGFVKAWVRCDL
jgi:threonine dehydrogenase-like Zn-dependent dehydrogenase